MILTCHTLCCTLQGIPARMGETLQSVQEAWLKLEAGENMRKSLLIKRISSAESANTQNRKIGKRVSCASCVVSGSLLGDSFVHLLCYASCWKGSNE